MAAELPADAILPSRRIVAFYGNFDSARMGILGKYPADELLKRLAEARKLWETADPGTPVVPAVDYIAVAAQKTPGDDGHYRKRMPPAELDRALDLANRAGGMLFLDVQAGTSDIETEVSLLEPYLRKPQVELSIDPEFAMKTGAPPGSAIGSLDAAEINCIAAYLAGLVRDNRLPKKILTVHRFLKSMITNASRIRTRPEVDIVINMDGWGPPAKKLRTYNDVVVSEPVQFNGFKLFYDKDRLPPSPGLMAPTEIVKLTPAPVYIQYQ